MQMKSMKQYFHLFTVAETFKYVMKSQIVIIQTNVCWAGLIWFNAAAVITLHKGVLIFEIVDEILTWDHSNESY